MGVVLPVHDEEKLLPRSLQSLEVAVSAVPPSISGRVAVVLDHCGDASSAIADTWGARFGALVIPRECGSVGWLAEVGAVPFCRSARRGPRENLVGDNRC